MESALKRGGAAKTGKNRPMPSVSIVIPCYNEQSTIGLLLDAILCQTYPLNEMEVIIADGMSVDDTRAEIERFGLRHPELMVRVVDNTQRNIPAAINCAIRAASGEYIVRLDAHCVPNPDYIEKSIEALLAGKGWNVGGVWKIEPGAKDWLARSIAAAAGHPFGVGDALYRYATQAQSVDTVPFGAFRRSLLDQIGLFDETLLTNEDYEFNTRIRAAGGEIWLDPAIASVYFARSTLGALAKQYWRYGYWKVRMLRRYPRSLRARQALPPLFVTGLVLLAVLAPIWAPFAWLLLGSLVTYWFVLMAGAVPAAQKQRDLRLLIGIPCAITVMHVCWGAGFLWSLLH